MARCEYDAVMPTPQGRRMFITMKALNEWDAKVCPSHGHTALEQCCIKAHIRLRKVILSMHTTLHPLKSTTAFRLVISIVTCSLAGLRSSHCVYTVCTYMYMYIHKCFTHTHSTRAVWIGGRSWSLSGGQ